MTEAEDLLVKIKFIVDMYNSVACTTDEALQAIFELVDSYEEEVEE